MAPVYKIAPDASNFWKELGVSTERISQITVNEVHIDTDKKSWTLVLSGESYENDAFWSDVGQQICAKVPEVASVRFDWSQLQQQARLDAEQDYLADAIKQFNGPAPTQTDTPKRKKRKQVAVKKVTGTVQKIADLEHEQRNVIVEGEIFAVDQIETKSGKIIQVFDVYDGSDSITCKLFREKGETCEDVSVQQRLRIKGNLQMDSFDKDLAIIVSKLQVVPPPPPLEDTAPEKRVEFHLHTKMSGMDGLIPVADSIQQAANWGHEAIAITDHGGVQAFPDAYFAGQKHGIKILYGMEGYLVEGPEKQQRSYHIVLLAKNKVGLKNLYKLVSYSHMEYFYKKPRIPRSLLTELREGLIIGSACEAGELYQAILENRPNIESTARFYDYLEIQPIGNNEFLIGNDYVQSTVDLQDINGRIVELGESLSIPVVATCDAHFLRPEDGIYRKILFAGQGYKDVEQSAPLFFRTTEEMLAEFRYLSEATAKKVVIDNPRRIAADIEPLTPVPQGLHTPEVPNAAEDLRTMTYQQAKELYGTPLPPRIEKRLERELTAIIDNGYAPLVLIAQKLVHKSLSDGYLVGSRGSVGSSLVATMCEITEVNPLPPHYSCPKCRWSEFIDDGSYGAGIDLPPKDCPQCGMTARRDGYDIPFETFMGFHGDKVPDIDLNFSGEYQAAVHSYTEELFGKEYVYRAGTIATLAEKTAFGFVMKYLEEGNKTMRRAEINRLVKKISGVRRTTGQHPGGMMVVPANMDVFDFTPIQHPANDSANGVETTHFSYSAIHDSLVKLDILGHDSPTMLRMLQDITGVSPNDIALDEPKTMALFSGVTSLDLPPEASVLVGSLGVPEFGTDLSRDMLLETKPNTFDGLVRIMGLSHGTNVWSNNAQDLIRAQTTDLAKVISCRDDIMVYLLHKGLASSDAFRIMEQVRKAKGLTPDDVTMMSEAGVPDWYVNSCLKISYLFPKAHAVAYAISSFKIAYFKVYHPEAFYAVYFSMHAESFDIFVVSKGAKAVEEEINSIRSRVNEATNKEKEMIPVLEVALEALMRGVHFLPIDLYASDAKKFTVAPEGVRPPLVSLKNVGLNAAAKIVEARKEGRFVSIEALRRRAGVTRPAVEVLRQCGCLEGLPETNQLELFS